MASLAIMSILLSTIMAIPGTPHPVHQHPTATPIPIGQAAAHPSPHAYINNCNTQSPDQVQQEIEDVIQKFCIAFIASVTTGDIQILDSLFLSLDDVTRSTFKSFYKETENRDVFFSWSNVIASPDEHAFSVAVSADFSFLNRRGSKTRFSHEYHWVVRKQEERWAIAEYQLSEKAVP